MVRKHFRKGNDFFLIPNLFTTLKIHKPHYLAAVRQINAIMKQSHYTHN